MCAAGEQWYIPRSNIELLKLCARGRTVFIASGDAGATNDGHGGSSCKVEPGKYSRFIAYYHAARLQWTGH